MSENRAENQSRSIWYLNDSSQQVDGTWSGSSAENHADPNAKQPNACGRRHSVFASNEELQDVINLLSCQPSNPSSPSSDSSVVSHPMMVAGDGTGFMWQTTAGPLSCGALPNYGKKQETDCVPLPQVETPFRLGYPVPWVDASNGTNFAWCLPPPSNESNGSSAYEYASDRAAYHMENIQHRTGNVSSMRVNSLPIASYRSGVRMSSNGQTHHPRATKSTSWPVVDFHPQMLPNNHHHVDSSSSSDHDDVCCTGCLCQEKEATFFMGLDLVGNDLMASVRQRRHSSGGNFTENAHMVDYPPPSTRTKSIDSISVDDTISSKTSTWPLKQPSPRSSYYSVYAGNNGQKVCEDQQLKCETQPCWPTSDFPQGLPPSGMENRGKHKMERKYSLFGHAT